MPEDPRAGHFRHFLTVFLAEKVLQKSKIVLANRIA